jgi:hypothetical protein
MKHHKPKYRYSPTPNKPELEISSSPSLVSDETLVPGAAQGSILEKEGTSFETPAETELTVPMHFPPREKLALNMVPADLIYRYDEYRSDESKMSSVFFTFLGAFLGVIINWVTSSQLEISKPSIIVELILLIVIVIFWIFTRIFNQRAKEAKIIIDGFSKRQSPAK